MMQDTMKRDFNPDLKKQFLEKREIAVGPLKNLERIRYFSESKQRSPPSLRLLAVSCDQMGPVIIWNEY